jgi:hypothetical protein
MSAKKNQIVHFKIVTLIKGLHAANAAPGTIVTYPDSEGIEREVHPHSGATVTYDKDEAGNALTCIALASGVVVARPVDDVPDTMSFAVTVVHEAKGATWKIAGGHWVNTATPAGAKAFELQKSKWPELPNNPEYTHGKGKVYAKDSSVGTSVTGTVSSVRPKTLCVPIEGVVVPPKTPPKAGGASAKKRKAEDAIAPPAKAAKKRNQPKLGQIKTASSTKVKATNRAAIYSQVFAHNSVPQLKKVLALYGYTHPAPKKGGKQPNADVMTALLHDELRKIWGI